MDFLKSRLCVSRARKRPTQKTSSVVREEESLALEEGVRRGKGDHD